MSVKALLYTALTELNVAVTPLGSPDAARFTLPLKPFWSVTPIEVMAADPPTRRFRLLTEEERLKPCCGMVSVMVVELVAVPEVPLTVTGYVP